MKLSPIFGILLNPNQGPWINNPWGVSTKQGTDSLLLKLERANSYNFARDGIVMTHRIGPVSYEALYTSHCAEVLRLCRLLLANDHDAEEVVQDVFLKAHQKQQKLDPTEHMLWRPWLIRVSINACRDRRRSGWWNWWRTPREEYQDTNHPSPSQTPEQALLSRETEACIWRAFQQLSQRQQEVFALRYVDEWSTEEVAKMLGLTPGSVKRYLFRAVQHLRRALGDCR